MSDIIVAAIGFLATFITGGGVFFLTRRKYRTELKNTELDNVDKAISIWRSLAQGLNEEQKEMEKQINMLREEIKRIEKGFQKKCEECKFRKFYNDYKKPE